jgi:catalase-peroxidase
LIFEDPLPKVNHKLIGDKEIEELKNKINSYGLSISQLVSTAWASASTFRGTDKRGGANGARIRLAPQKSWEVNQPEELSKVLNVFEKIQSEFNSSRNDGIKVSIADLLVLAGGVAVEQAAQKAGVSVTVPFVAGRVDALQDQTDVDSFSVLEPKADGFRNFASRDVKIPTEELLIEKACLLKLTAPEMTVLVGGLRVLNANYGKSDLGVFTHKPETLTNDFFVNLLDMDVQWKPSAMCKHFYEGTSALSGQKKWNASGVDLVFGSNSVLRSICEVYASDDAKEKFVKDFVAAWVKVMNADRFDLK